MSLAKKTENKWILSTVKALCKCGDYKGAARTRKAGSGIPKTSCSEENITNISELIFSEENQSFYQKIKDSSIVCSANCKTCS